MQSRKILPRGDKQFIQRLNILLKLADRDLALLNNGAWEKLLDELYYALYEAKREPGKNDEGVFSKIATREGIREAQKTLQRQLPLIQNPRPNEVAKFSLSEQELWILADADGYYGLRWGTNFSTAFFEMLDHMLRATEVKPGDFLTCSREDCDNLFIPARKPQKEAPSYCSTRCATIVATRRYRERLAERAAKEREKNLRQYAKNKGAKAKRKTAG